MPKLSTSNIILLISYAVVCIAIGIWSALKQKDDDFLIAGRKLTTLGFIASVVAGYIGGNSLVAYTAFVYQYGISAISLFVGTAIGFLLFIYYALRIRRVGKEKKFLTLSDWFYEKFDKRSGFLSSLMILLVYFGFLMNQFIAGSAILSSISGWSYESALLLSGAVIIVYLMLGGYNSVIRTDIFQYFVLLVLLIMVGFVMFGEKRSHIVDLFDSSQFQPTKIAAFMIYGISYVFFSAEYWQKTYAAKNDKVIRNGLRGSAVLIIISGLALSLIGLYAWAYIPGLEPKDAAASGLAALLPESLIGLGLMLIFAAIMSSADTMVFVLSTSVAKDYVARFKTQKTDDRQLKNLTRTFIIIFSILSITGAFFFRDIISLILTVTGIGFSLIPSVIASFHWKIHNLSAFASLISGFVYILILIFTGNLISEAAVASAIVSAFVLILFQLFLRKKQSYSKT